MDSLEFFNLTCARVFAECYAHFPEPRDLSAEDFAKGDRERHMFTLTIAWLVNSGWLTTSNKIRFSHYGDCQLTEKALVALGWTPGPLRFLRSPSIGQRLVEAAAKGALEATAGKLVLLAFKAVGM